MKPHEEEWTFTWDEEEEMGAVLADRIHVMTSTVGLSDDEKQTARLRLAAHAPAMARLLLAYLKGAPLYEMHAEAGAVLRAAGVLE